MPTIVNIPGVGDICFVDRRQLRFTSHGRMAAMPHHTLLADMLPTPPASFDWSKGESIQYPLAGNNRYGNCYYVAVCNGSRTFTGNAGQPCTFDENQLIQRYLRIAGGDNGLNDETIMPEWKRGVVGPDGSRKIIDEMQVNVNDPKAIALSLWAFNGLIWTCALLNTWQGGPGVIWTGNGRPNQRMGHAMWITGINSSGRYDVRTWGISPPVQLTTEGLLASHSELIAAFSLDMFNAQGIAPSGLSYEESAKLWQQLGGGQLPPSPFPPVQPAPPIDWTKL